MQRRVLSAWQLPLAICIVAGVYLISLESPGEGTTIFEAIATGMGIYFIGKGIAVGASIWLQQKTLRTMERLVEMEALQHERETRGD